MNQEATDKHRKIFIASIAVVAFIVFVCSVIIWLDPGRQENNDYAELLEMYSDEYASVEGYLDGYIEPGEEDINSKQLEKDLNNPFDKRAEEFLKKYPRSDHADDVWMMRIRKFIDLEMPAESVKLIANYRYQRPKGKYLAKSIQIYDSLWNVALKDFNLTTSERKGDGIVFMRGLLNYMKSHRLNRILVEIESTDDCYGFSDYPSDVCRMLIDHRRNASETDNSSDALKIPEDLKYSGGSFNTENMEEYLQDLYNPLEYILAASMFEDFVKVGTSIDADEKVLSGAEFPVIKITIRAKNAETTIGGKQCPVISAFHPKRLTETVSESNATELVQEVVMDMTATLSYSGCTTPFSISFTHHYTAEEIESSLSDTFYLGYYGTVKENFMRKLGSIIPKSLGLDD